MRTLVTMNTNKVVWYSKSFYFHLYACHQTGQESAVYKLDYITDMHLSKKDLCNDGEGSDAGLILGLMTKTEHDNVFCD